MLVPAAAPLPKTHQRVALRLAARTHYLQSVYVMESQPRAEASYVLGDYRELLSLPRPDGSVRSMYGSDGLVAGSERRERYLLWPFGVPSPGAMRQPGTHAIAFVGRRHFDEPYLLERLLEPYSSAGNERHTPRRRPK